HDLPSPSFSTLSLFVVAASPLGPRATDMWRAGARQQPADAQPRDGGYAPLRLLLSRRGRGNRMLLLAVPCAQLGIERASGYQALRTGHATPPAAQRVHADMRKRRHDVSVIAVHAILPLKESVRA